MNVFPCWLAGSGVWRRLLSAASLDDRVVDAVERAKLLPALCSWHDPAFVAPIVALALPRLERASVQNLLAGWLLHSDFPRPALLLFLQRLARQLGGGKRAHGTRG